ncbi:MAG: DNA repair exonuclease [Aminobacterium colombiense]|nr:DNA repair exonuclease [Aminobacterium colombiense]
MGLQRDFTFLHCADLHLDSPFRGVRSYSPAIAGMLQDAVFKSFERVVDLALRERVDFVLLSGDLYDSADRSLSAQLALRRQLLRLSQAGIFVYMVHGNHDPLSGDRAKLSLPERVFQFKGEVEVCPLYGKNDALIGHIAGYSYPTGDERGNVAIQMAKALESRKGFNVALLHCNVGGMEGHENYAPCSIEDLRDSSVDYWALGHIHRPMILSCENPLVVYPGTIQGRSVRETGPRGCYLVTVSAQGSISPIFYPTDKIRWWEETLDISSVEEEQVLMDTLENLRGKYRKEAEGRGIMLRVTLTGNTSLYRRLGRDGFMETLIGELNREEEALPDFVWIEAIQNKTRPDYSIENLRKTQTFVGDFLREMDTVRSQIRDNETLFALMDEGLGNGRWRRGDLEPYLQTLEREDIAQILEKAAIKELDGLLKGENDPCVS